MNVNWEGDWLKIRYEISSKLSWRVYEASRGNKKMHNPSHLQKSVSRSSGEDNAATALNCYKNNNFIRNF